MTNKQYTEKTIGSVERILVDTSTLMSNGFQQFIHNNQGLLTSGGKKIIVPKAVYTELARHLGSADSKKSELALAAVELLAIHKELFSVESAPLTEDEIAHAFADAQLLSELTLHRSKYNQLLITNDRNLSCDAFDLNQQQSCKGRKVLVCYINWCGELQCCECARTNTEQIIAVPVSTISEIPASLIPESTLPKVSQRTEEVWKFDWASGLVSISGLGMLYGIFKSGKTLIKYFI